MFVRLFVALRKSIHALTSWLVLAGLAAGLCMPGGTAAAPDEPVDGYGYTYNVVSQPWVDANGGNLLTFPSLDDAFVGPLDIGFDFHFYEYPYSTLFVSTNGLVTFGMGTLGLQTRLYPIPWAPLPNNLIAPMWSNLNLQNGRVYLYRMGVSPSRSTVIEWELYDRPPGEPGALLTLNFELILSEEDQGILFQYNVLDGMPGESAVGIEDSQGVNGLEYMPPLAVGDDILFIRPAPGPRVRATPRFQGSFVYGLSAEYRVDIQNNGDYGADVYNLEVASAAPGWQVAFYNRTSGVLLNDTGSLAQGEGLSLALKVSAPANAEPGDFTTLVYTATSTLDASRWMTGTVQSAVPLQFAQVFVDGARGIRLGQFWQDSPVERPILSSYPGASLSMEAVSADNYLVAWEAGQSTLAKVTDFFTDIHYKIASRFGGTGAELVLTDGAQVVADPQVSQADARSPAIAPAPDGRVGVAWSLLKYRPGSSGGSEFNSNVYFAILDSVGARLSSRFNVTSDSGWFTGGHSYESPNLAVTGDGRYLVCWIDRFEVGSGVRCAVHTFDGQQISQTATVQVDTLDPAANSLADLAMTTLVGNQVLIAYSEIYPDVSKVHYAVRSSAGGVVVAPTEVSGADGDQPRLVQFASGEVLLAWIDRDGRVVYSYLDPMAGYTAGPPQILSHISGRAADGLSVTLVQGGLAVLTWVDRDAQDYLYYAALEKDQNLVTPPQIFLSDPFGDPQYQTSAFGFGNAGYQGVYQRYIPLVRR
jgi:hypothetical protein